VTAHGVANYVLEPTSILINRRARRAKTDRLDAIGMLRVLAAYLRGDRQSCSMVRVPTPEDEDAKRIHRERENLVQEKLRIENRIEALLFTQGIRKRPSLRSWEHDLAVLHTGDGREMPRHLRAELDRLRRRLVTILELIREVEAERDEVVTTNPEHQTSRKIVALCRIRGLGENFAGVLTREVFYRSFDNRRQIASYVGITPMPYQSGSMDRDRRISRAGNPRARTTMIQLAWLWQPPAHVEADPGKISVVCHGAFDEVMRDGIKEGFDIQIDHPVVIPTAFPRRRHCVKRRTSRSIAIGVSYQPASELAEWFRKRVGTLPGRTGGCAIGAMARKLLIALGRYAERGVLPAGAEIRPESVAAA